jgi:hypothetical protein
MLTKQLHFYPRHPGQIAVFDDPARFKWIYAGRKWRKTSGTVRPAVLAAMKGKHGFWGSPSADQTGLGWEESKKATREVAKPFESFPHRLEFIGGGTIIYETLSTSAAEFSRGGNWDFFVIDEAAQLAPFVWQEIILPIMASRPDSWANLMTTPRGMNWFWQEWVKAKTKPDSKAWQIPALGIEIQDRTLVRKPHPLENPFYPLEGAQTLFDNTPLETFRQEFLAEIIEGEGLVFRNVDTCCVLTTEDKPDPAGTILGVDLGKHQDFTVIFGLNPAGQETYFDRFNQIDWVLQEERIVSASQVMQAPVILDSTGLGDPVFDALVSKGIEVYPYKFTSESKGKLIRTLSVDFDRKEPRLVDREVVKGELKSFAYEQKPVGGFTYSAPEGMHDDTVTALGLSNWGRKNYSSMAAQAYSYGVN